MRKCSCGEDIAPSRLKLGIVKCLFCGEKEAAKETEAKSKRVSIAYPKGPFMYQGAPEVAAKNLADSTDTRRQLYQHQPLPANAVAIKKVLPKQKPKKLGIYWLPGETGTHGGTVFFDLNDPMLAKAARKVLFA